MRSKFQGVRQIFAFNQPFYLGSITALAGAAAASVFLPRKLRLAVRAGCGVGAWFTVASLAASYYVYDRSGLYGFEWLESWTPQRWIQLHAGLDETSEIFRRLWPAGEGVLFDVYDPRQMSEPSILRARQLAGSRAAAARSDALPVEDGWADAVLLIFTAHEIRTRDSRVRFLAEVRRVLAPHGTVVLMEHLRDASNFAVFGPGFLHFLSAAEWRQNIAAAGLRVSEEFALNPFVRVFLIR